MSHEYVCVFSGRRDVTGMGQNCFMNWEWIGALCVDLIQHVPELVAVGLVVHCVKGVSECSMPLSD